MRKVVLLDVDGVVADLVSPTVQHLNNLLNPKLSTFTVDDVTQWDIAKSLAQSEYTGWAYAFDRALQILFNQEQFVASLPVYDGAIECVKRMAAVADVYFVTAGRPQSKYWHYERLQWIERHFSGLYNDVIFVQQKHLVHGDFFLDDKASNANAWRDKWSYTDSAHACLMLRPWNQGENVLREVSRLGFLAGFAEIVEEES